MVDVNLTLIIVRYTALASLRKDKSFWVRDLFAGDESSIFSMPIVIILVILENLLGQLGCFKIFGLPGPFSARPRSRF